MKRIGLTGGIGSGKSYIAGILEKMGYPVYYSDAQSKVLTDTHPLIREKLIARFGREIYTAQGLNRKVLAELIFASEEHRLFVNELIHPLVRNNFEHWCSEQQSPIVFNEAAILFETGAYRQFDGTLLVVAPLELRIERVMQRDRCSKKEVEERMKSQWSDDQKIPLATAVITSNGKFPLVSQIERSVQTLLSL
ncbi:MAG: dephospho-CoA kinase [Flavobacteriia bacterium]|nr:dephospho-CoA kinase [Flavobacteriia bacterium]